MDKIVILTKAERIYFSRLKAMGKLKPKEKTAFQKVVEELSKKLPLNTN